MLLLIRASGLHLRGDEASNQNTEAKGKSFPTLPTKPVVIICLSHEINLSLVHYFDSQTMAKQICSFELFERIRIGVSVHKLKKNTDRSAPAPKNGTTFWNVYQERQGDVINTRR